VDDEVVFHPLDMRQVEAILDIELGELSGRLAEQGFSLRVQPSARKILVEKGWDSKFGGRPLRRAIQKELEDPLSRLILGGAWTPGALFVAEARKGAIHISGRISAEPSTPAGVQAEEPAVPVG
jgi:ATP-dependent Clp protease ATP-binding subunit ClpA